MSPPPTTTGNPRRQQRNLLRQFFSGVASVFHPITAVVEDPALGHALAEALHLRLSTAPADSAHATDDLERYLAREDPDLEAFVEVAVDLVQAVDVIRRFVEACGPNAEADVEELVWALIELLSLQVSRRRAPFLYALMRLLGFLEEEIDLVGGGAPRSTRLAQILQQQVLDVGQAAHLRTPQDAKALMDRIGIPVVGVITFLFQRLRALYRWDAPPSGSPIADEILDRTLSIALDFGPYGGSTRGLYGGEVTLSGVFVPVEHGGPGLVLSIGGETGAALPLGDTGFVATFDFASAETFGVYIPFEGSTTPFRANLPTDFASGTLSLGIARVADPTAPPYVLGDPNGTRIQYREVGVQASLHAATQAGLLFDGKATLQEFALIITRGTGDGFLARVLPPGELRVTADLAFGWDTRRGFYFEGAPALRLVIPTHIDLGPLHVQSIGLEISPVTTVADGTTIPCDVTFSFGVTLGPFAASVQDIGFRIGAAFPPHRDVQLVAAFKPPRGVGLSLDAGPVTGGGFILFDPDHGSYAGIATVQIEGAVTIDAIVLINTIPATTPGAAPTYSFFALATLELASPISIVFGIGLAGIGILVGINRSAAIAVLHAGVKTHLLDSIMFPHDPVRNAPQIIANLGAAFPPTPDHHVIGAMLKLVWPATAQHLVEATLGLAVEIVNGSVKTWIIFGQFAIKYPKDSDTPKVLIHIDLLGTIETDTGEVAFDASLADSKILTWTLTGDAAYRSHGGDAPIFLLSLGGFHPHFHPPDGFPDLDRLALSISTGDNFRIRFELYLAVTANAFQIGAHLEFYAGIAGFSVEARGGFDALFQFSPFAFDIDVDVYAAVKLGGETIFSVNITANLTGPSPWHLVGELAFSILFWTIHIPIDCTFGSATPDPPTTVSVSESLTAAMQERGAWRGELPASAATIAALRELPPSSVIRLHPLADLAVAQNVVPLGLDITHLGSARVLGEKRFDVTRVTISGGAPPAPPSPVTELFAPAQYVDLTDAQKLARPSFEPMQGGVRFGIGGVAHGAPVKLGLTYDTTLVDPMLSEGRRVVAATTMTLATMHALAEGGASAKSPARTTGTKRFSSGSGPRVSVADPTFVLAGLGDLGVRAVGGGTTFAHAEQEKKRWSAVHPDQPVQVIPKQEAQTS